MQSIDYLARQRSVNDAANGALAGPAAAALASVAVRTAAIIRCMAVGYTGLQIAIWHAYFVADPLRLIAPAAAMAWGATLVAWLARHPPTAGLAVADSAVHIPLALSTAWSVPAAMRGDTANWLYILLAGQTVVPLWFAPLAASAPTVLAVGAAHWAGAAFLPLAGTGRSALSAATVLYFAVGTVAWLGHRMLRNRAVLADTALSEADADEHEQYVTLSRSTERREHERLLHDTVLNTLTALARDDAVGHDTREIVGRCLHDVALMEYALGGAAQAGPPPGGTVGGLVAAVEAVAAEMRARGLDVGVRVDAPGAGAFGVPVPVIAALTRAVRESLDNVARHAGTGQAFVGVAVRAPGAGAEDRGGLVVTVRDNGVGFEPSRVGPDRLGVRRSIVERVADCGGTASLRSTPGAGATVTLCWPGEARRLPGDATEAPVARDPPPGRPGAGARSE